MSVLWARACVYKSAWQQKYCSGKSWDINKVVLYFLLLNVFAYCAGKTHTILGTAETPGIIPRCVADLFTTVRQQQLNDTTCSFVVSYSYFEIYNEKVLAYFMLLLLWTTLKEQMLCLNLELLCFIAFVCKSCIISHGWFARVLVSHFCWLMLTVSRHAPWEQRRFWLDRQPHYVDATYSAHCS